jgi:magnesium chelatase family protein
VALRAGAITWGVVANAQVPPHRLDDVAPLTSGARGVLRAALEAGQLTGRGLTRVRTVALTLADLAGASEVGEELASAALALRAVPSSVLGSRS